jgi:hypothetical protein
VIGLQIPMMGRCRSWTDAVEDPASSGEFADAVAYFRGVLGEKWPGWLKGSPLATVFDVGFQGQPREWVRLYRLIRALDDAPGLASLLKQVGSSEWKSYMAAVMALEFCGRMRSSGVGVVFVETDDHESPPDAVLSIDPRRKMVVEFKALHDSDEAERWDPLTNWLLLELTRRCLDASAYDIEFDEAALVEREALLEGVLTAYEDRPLQFRALPLGTGRIRLRAGDMGCWRDPVRDRPELDRLVGKLKGRWQKKFTNVSTSNVLVVRTRMFFVDNLAEKVGLAGTRLKAALAGRPRVSAVVVYDDIGQPYPTRYWESPGLRVATGTIDGCGRVALLVENPSARVALSEIERDVLVGHQMSW